MLKLLYWYWNMIVFKAILLLETCSFWNLWNSVSGFSTCMYLAVTLGKVKEPDHFHRTKPLLLRNWIFYSKMLLRNVLFVACAVPSKGRQDEGNNVLFQWICVCDRHLTFEMIKKIQTSIVFCDFQKEYQI